MMKSASVQEAMSRAVQLHQAGRLPEAAAIYRQVLQQEPNHANALHLLGLAAHQSGDHHGAVRTIAQAIRANPMAAEFHNNLGEAFRSLGMADQAAQCYETAIGLKPGYAEAHANLGSALLQMGRLDEAVSAYRRAIELKGDIAGVHSNLGQALHAKGLLDEAIVAFRRSIELRGDFPNTHFHLANALKDKGRGEEAVAAYRRAIALRPDFAAAHNRLGDALRDVGRLDETVPAYRRAVEINPGFVEAQNNLAGALAATGQVEKALAECRRTLELRPDLAAAHLTRAMLLLLTGCFAEGWAEYEWRWEWAGAPSPMRDPTQPVWRGEDPRGRAILVQAEQGFGDTIQFIRYAPLLAQRGARVIVECRPELKPLLQALEGVEQVLAEGEPLPPCDLRLPLLSAPLAFRTTLETVPANVPYLRPDPARVDQWRSRLAPRSTPVAPRLKVGLAWAGKPVNMADWYRSMPLSSLAPLADVKDVRFYSLQKGSGEQAANAPAPMALCDLTNELRDFADTAALIANLDLVITVDTAVAHLAGAMAKPVWTLLPFVPEWRWLLDREDSPWYPTMRLFRQKTRGDWAGVVERVAGELNRRVQGSEFRVQ